MRLRPGSGVVSVSVGAPYACVGSQRPENVPAEPSATVRLAGLLATRFAVGDLLDARFLMKGPTRPLGPRRLACTLTLSGALGLALASSAVADSGATATTTTDTTATPATTDTTTTSATTTTSPTTTSPTTTTTTTATPPTTTTTATTPDRRTSPGGATGWTTSTLQKCPPGTSVRNLCEPALPGSPKAKPGSGGRARPPAAAKVKPRPSAAAPPASSTIPLPASAALYPGLSLRWPAGLTPVAATAMNFLIGAFPVPPFLLPIYEAAAVDYGVPWEVLAAINEVETDYGRNLSTSTAGAVGWMQFLPSTWARYGMDADGRGSANPYDPVDAIFAAARYLHAAGADANLSGAIFAYNHADWYVNSVQLRARLLQYLPTGLVDGLSGLMQASFPVAGHLGRYAAQLPASTVHNGRPAALLSAPAGAPVIAATDARVVAIGRSIADGTYITLQDAYGNRFTYSGLGSEALLYPVLKPRVRSVVKLTRELGAGSAPAGGALLPAASQRGVSASRSNAVVDGHRSVAGPSGAAPNTQAQVAALPKERLFADPARPASYAAGGKVQLQSSLMAYAAAADLRIGGRADYFSQPIQLSPGEFTLAPLTRGAVVAGGTIIGRVGRGGHGSQGIGFQIRPVGATAPVDPAPIIAGWELLGRLTAGRAALVGPRESGAYGDGNASLGQLLLGDKQQLEQAVLSDTQVTIDGCDRLSIQAGRVDRRVLAALEYLSFWGIRPVVSGLDCGNAPGSSPQFSISQLDGVPVAGHQQDGGIVDVTIRRMLGLQGVLRPTRIISLRSYPMESVATALPDHGARIEVDFSPSASTVPGGAPATTLDTAQWTRLISRLTELSSPQP